jgi:hypothetical protein
MIGGCYRLQRNFIKALKYIKEFANGCAIRLLPGDKNMIKTKKYDERKRRVSEL